MSSLKKAIDYWIFDFFRFVKNLVSYFIRSYLSPRFAKFEGVKGFFVGKLYQQRGKYSRLIVNGAMVAVMVLGVTMGPSLVVNDTQAQAMLSSGLGNRIVFAQDVTPTAGAQVLGLTSDNAMAVDTMTQVSDKPRAEVTEYKVEEGETFASIAKKFGVDVDSIKWLNKGVQEKKVRAGMTLQIPPVSGVIHTVKSGETIYSVAKRYNVSAQAIVDFPFNEFSNDETFAIAIGQTLVVPDGEMPDEPVTAPRNNLAQQMTPSAGVISATGSWIWPAAGKITQGFKSWHKAIDIANRDGGAILAADSGTVVVAGWPDNSGYGNRVMIDHGNGYRTLYAHLSKISVVIGQTVKRGNVIGQMGSTGRSTGNHLHFEIRMTNGLGDPLAYLR